MVVKVLHIAGGGLTDDAAAQLTLLLEQLPRSRFAQHVQTIGARCGRLRLPSDVPINRLAGGDLVASLANQGLFWLSDPLQFDLVVSWDLFVFPARRDSSRSRPWVAFVSDSSKVGPAAHWQRVVDELSTDPVFVCPSPTVRQELMQGRVQGSRTEVIRTPVSLAAIRQADRQRVRAELDLPLDAKVLLTACPPVNEGGQYTAVWAAAILYQIWKDVRMILPGGFREDRRARRLSEECYCPEIFRVAGEGYGPAELLAASDMVVWPAQAGSSAGWLGWAMAAGVPIVATRSPVVADLIEDGKTGFLASSSRPHAVATRIRMAWEDDEAQRACVQEASHRGYELFRPQKCLDDWLSLFERMR